MDEERRLPPFAEDTLTLLTDAAGGIGESISKDEAKTVIADEECFSEADAEDTLELLHSRGYIYSVGETIRVTPTDD